MQTYYILDTETTGLAPPKTGGSGLVEVAYMRIDPETLEDMGAHAFKVNPECDIHPEAQAAHGISYDDVKDAPVMAPLFTGEKVTIIAHNASFDLRFVSKYIENLVGSLCTLALARQYVTDAPNHKLGTLVQHLNLDSGKAHSALGDVISTHALLKNLVARSGRPLQTLTKAAAKPKLIHVMPFGKYKGVPIINLDKDYVKWFLEQDIDKDLRASLEMSLKV
jgi:DNA polymerase III epsilon subunit-like protein